MIYDFLLNFVFEAFSLQTRLMEVDINDMILRLLCVGNPEKGLTKTVRASEIIALCGEL